MRPYFRFNTFQKLLFYLGRPVTVVECEGELKMGIGLEPVKSIKRYDGFQAIWQNLDQAAVVFKLNRLKHLDVKALQGRVVYKGPKTMVIVKS